MTPIRLRRRQAQLVDAVIDRWRRDGAVSAETAAALSATIEAAPFDWRRLSRIAIAVAVLCLAAAGGAVLADRDLKALLERLLDWPSWARSAALAALAAVLYAVGFHRRRTRPENEYTNEGMLLLAVLATAAAIYFLGRTLPGDAEHVSLLVLCGALVYGAVAIWSQSRLVWVCALLSLGGWFGAETGYRSGWGYYYLGLNYPLRFALFGVALCAASYGMGRAARLRPLVRTTFAMGLLYLFLALWILSIFGDLDDGRATPGAPFHWSLLFAAAAAAAIWHGIRLDDPISHGFGATFLLINLYTRFFEHFWDRLHAAVFFAVLGASLWLLGSQAQRLWNLGRRREIAES